MGYLVRGHSGTRRRKQVRFDHVTDIGVGITCMFYLEGKRSEVSLKGRDNIGTC